MTNIALEEQENISPSKEIVVPDVKCPDCGLLMSYVGDDSLDSEKLRDEIEDLNWKQMEQLASGESAVDDSSALRPAKFKCYHCQVQPLSSSRQTWLLEFGHFSAKDAANAALRKSILERDKFTCMDCTMQLPTHMEVRHLDEDHSNNDPANLRCVCPFCHMRDHLGPTGIAGAATVIALPYLSQAQINNIVLMSWYITSRVKDVSDIRAGKTSDNEGFETEAKLLNAAAGLLSDIEKKGVTWCAHVNSKSPLDPYIFGKMLNRMREQEFVPKETPDAEIAHLSPDKEIRISDDDPDFKVLDLPPGVQSSAYKARNISLAAMRLFPKQTWFEDQCNDWFAYFDKVRPVSIWGKARVELYKALGIDSPETLHAELTQHIALKDKGGTPPPPSRPKAKAPSISATPPAVEPAAQYIAQSTAEDVVAQSPKTIPSAPRPSASETPLQPSVKESASGSPKTPLEAPKAAVENPAPAPAPLSAPAPSPVPAIVAGAATALVLDDLFSMDAPAAAPAPTAIALDNLFGEEQVTIQEKPQSQSTRMELDGLFGSEFAEDVPHSEAPEASEEVVIANAVAAVADLPQQVNVPRVETQETAASPPPIAEPIRAPLVTPIAPQPAPDQVVTPTNWGSWGQSAPESQDSNQDDESAGGDGDGDGGNAGGWDLSDFSDNDNFPGGKEEGAF